ncbi:hypothetical protein MK338_04000, partial [Streptococcus vestibularis]|nr:hypothetical protein [Streptococcus vestibularis]
ISTWAENTPC